MARSVPLPLPVPGRRNRGVTRYCPFSAVYISFQDLRYSVDYSYEELRFGDAWFSVYQAPQPIIDNIKRLPGVEAAEGRIIEDVSVKLPFQVKDKVTCRIISMPSPQPDVNRVLILDGSYPRERYSGLIHEDFYQYYGLNIGDQLRLEIQGKNMMLRYPGPCAPLNTCIP